MSINLQGAIACVTGGGRGIGRATAMALAAKGARVCIGDIDLAEAEAVAKEIGKNAQALHLDVSDAASFTAFIAAAEKLGPLALLVNNAGIMRTGSFTEQDLAGQHREIAINLGGVVNGMALALPGMLTRNHGHIVNVSSMAGKMSVPGAAVYTASKFAVAALSRTVRAEISDSKVSIATIMPAAVRTELTAGLDTRGVPTVGPEDVAAAILRSCVQGNGEYTLPRWLAPIGLIEEALPEKLGSYVKLALGTKRRITMENAQRQHYRART